MPTIDVQLSYPPSSVALRTTPYGLIVTLAGASGIGEPGDPSLPRAIARIALPEGAIAVGVDAQVLATRELTGEPILLAPVQPPRPGNGRHPPLAEPTAPARVALPNKARYAELRTRPLVRLLEPGDPEVPVATVEVNALALNPDDRLVLHERVRITVTYQHHRLDGRRRFRDQRQAVEHHALLRQLVVNPDMLTVDLGRAVEPPGAEYLVITDRHRWDAATITQGSAVDGDPVAEFGRLVEWKRARGLSARVVTVEDIVEGWYGDFGARSVTPRPAARDLQEVIREFLKHARNAWGTRWVLLGGDLEIVPIRLVAGGLVGDVPPERTEWSRDELLVDTRNLAEWWVPSAGNTLLRADTGQVIPYDPGGADQVGWHFAGDGDPGDRVVVRGVDAPLRWLYTWNQIPTDFYYASLVGPGYDDPNRCDWDPGDTGVYDPRGITWQAHVSVGRAPIRGGADAAAFVDKVLAYEQLPEAAFWTSGHIYEREMVIAADPWGGRIVVCPTSLATPGEPEYLPGADRSVLRLVTADVPITYELYAQVSPDDVRFIPYDAGAAPGRRGWFYATSPTDLTPSVLSLPAGGRVPAPTSTIVVFSSVLAELNPQLYVLDEPVADASPTDQDLVAGIAGTVMGGLTGIRRLYTDGPERLTTAALTAALNDGPHLVSLSGHGSPWGGVCGLDSWLAGSLTNGEPGFIGYADSCLTAAVDQGSMGERLVTNPDGGAVGFVGNTRFSWVGHGDDFQRLFWQRLATTRHLGLLADSRCELVHTAGTNTDVSKWIILSLNLLGDPEMPVWQRRPRRLRVPAQLAGEWVVRDERNRPVPGAVVTVTYGDDSARAPADDAGMVRLPAVDSPAELLITAPGYRPIRTVL